MSGHFTILYRLPENLYANGSPVIIEAGSLLKDETSGAILVQLKIKNIQGLPISAATVAICAMDTAGRQLGPEIAFDYLDLDVRRDGSFGDQTPLLLPNNATRQFSVRVIEVIFPGKKIWNGEGKIWEAIPKGESLDRVFPDYEMQKQFLLRFGKQCKQKAYVHDDLWICACSGINRIEETACHSCRLGKENILSPDTESLRKDKNARLERERREREEKRRLEEERQAKLKAEREEKKEKAILFAKKYWKYALAALLVICFLAIVPRQIGKAMERAKLKKAYSAAVELKEAGSFDEAIEAFGELGDYKDSKEQIDIVKELKTEAENQKAYDVAAALATEKKYDEAIEAFEDLNGYKDSDEQIEKIQTLKADEAYDAAAALVAEKKYDEAIEAFEDLDGYKDSDEQIEKIQTLKADEAYDAAAALFKEEKYNEAIEAFEELDGYKDSDVRIKEAKDLKEKEDLYQSATESLKKGKYKDAIRTFEKLGTYKDSNKKVDEAKAAEEEAEANEKYENAVSLLKEGEFDDAEKILKELGSYKDSVELVKSIPERRRQAAIEKVAGVVIRDGKAFEYGDFKGKAIEWNNVSGDYSVYYAASETNPDEFHLFALYKGPKKELKDSAIHLVLDGTDVFYELTMLFEFKDKTFAPVYESGSFKAAGYRPGIILYYEKLDAADAEKKLKGFADLKETRELPTKYIKEMLGVLENILKNREIKLKMYDLGFYIYGD